VCSRLLADRLRVVSLEIYEDGVLVRYLIPTDGEFDLWSEQPHTEIGLADDAGTPYSYVSSGGSGVADAIRGDVHFIPAPPPHVDAVSVRHRGDSIRIGLA
jgi:hypothetical protein